MIARYDLDEVVIESVTPLGAAEWEPITLTLLGRNFKDYTPARLRSATATGQLVVQAPACHTAVLSSGL